MPTAAARNIKLEDHLRCSVIPDATVTAPRPADQAGFLALALSLALARGFGFLLARHSGTPARDSRLQTVDMGLPGLMPPPSGRARPVFHRRKPEKRLDAARRARSGGWIIYVAKIYAR